MDRSYEPWSVDEDLDLLAEINEERSLANIASMHSRSEGAIQSRRAKLFFGDEVRYAIKKQAMEEFCSEQRRNNIDQTKEKLAQETRWTNWSPLYIVFIWRTPPWLRKLMKSLCP